MDDKKKRGTNFNTNEIGLLMKLLVPELRTIENKKTDGATMKEKNCAWQRITTAFNSMNSNGARDINSLKMKYDNIKKALKKKISDNKENYRGTGGGPPVDTKLSWYEEELYALLQLGIEGLSSVGDSDAIIEETNQNNDINTVANEHDYVFQESSQNFRLPEEPWNIELNGQYEENIPAISGPSTLTNSQVAATPDIHIINETVPTRIISTPSTATNRWNLKKRKRTVTSAEKNNNIESFQKITEKKTELLEIQKDCYKIELNNKEGEWKLKNEILEVELQIKHEQYKQLKNDEERKKTLFTLQEEAERLKVELLKCEFNMKIRQNLGFATDR